MTKDKYVGEMSVDETEETLTDPSNRILKQITLDDFEEAATSFENLMGDNITARKNFIKEHSKDALYNAE